MQRSFIARWRRTVAAWCEMIEGATVLHRSEIVRLFPAGEIWTERLM
ncbi:hypothetical protein [Paragemmobacter ruber]|uniref:Uncharacterized protein n=1 Tax=Paragemmobacter ruber TaxID=1985673 RepID=A0ABW9Y818_9RHOB|nr:hypothetical protein [Rhodobacter ruber]NBE08731.1 hypothetical protein [Rhodobacter ruber]